MEAQKYGRRVAMVLVVSVVIVLFSTGCLCCTCSVPSAVRDAGSFGRAMPWRGFNIGNLISGSFEARQEVSGGYDVTGPAKLEVDVTVGSVRIEPGKAGRIQVSGTRRAWAIDQAQAEARLSGYQVTIRQTAPNTVAVETDGPSVGAQSPQVDLVIAVPPQTDVRAVLNVGDLEVTGIEGALDLTASVGSVMARDVTLAGSSYLTTNVGNVTVRLPARASFRLDARTSIGDVSCQFPLQDSISSSTLVGQSLSGRVGEAPMATLTLRANTGEVSVEQE